MINKNKTLELLNYIHEPMSKESLLLQYNINNIKFEKCELFNDFIQSLMDLIFDTYVGDDFMNVMDQKGHFKWCWNRTVASFRKEGILIGDIKVYNYFMDFMFDMYYPKNKVDEQNLSYNILRLWAYIFDYTNVKSKADADNLIEIYKLLEQSLGLEN